MIDFPITYGHVVEKLVINQWSLRYFQTNPPKAVQYIMGMDQNQGDKSLQLSLSVQVDIYPKKSALSAWPHDMPMRSQFSVASFLGFTPFFIVNYHTNPLANRHFFHPRNSRNNPMNSHESNLNCWAIKGDDFPNPKPSFPGLGRTGFGRDEIYPWWVLMEFSAIDPKNPFTGHIQRL